VYAPPVVGMLIFLKETIIVDLTVLGTKNEKRETLQFQQLKNKRLCIK